ncbi:MAG: sugar phosphate isomerase/epimerase family protein [Bryobacteraceae bacterium]
MEPRIRLAAITDEFSPALSEAIPPMKEIGMTGAELRVVNGKNIMDLSDIELQSVKEELERAELPVISIASPLLKCILPNSPQLDSRFEHDVFASKHTYEDQERLAAHAFNLAKLFGAKIIRVFSYWRTIEPDACTGAIVEDLRRLAELAKGEGLIIGLENEHACNVATGSESAAILNALDHPNLRLVWDPANALVAGEDPVPYGYEMLPKSRIVHVHAKDCHMENGRPVWGPLGTRAVRWKEQIASLLADGYGGFLSLETHWPGPGGDKLEASRICGWNLRGLSAA